MINLSIFLGLYNLEEVKQYKLLRYKTKGGSHHLSTQSTADCCELHTPHH